MPNPTDTAEAALERLRRILARWPRPAAGQGVRADAVLAGLAPMLPLAEMVLALPVGYSKGFYPGAGYLSGSSRITTDDLKLARSVEQDLNVILPHAGERALTRQLYNAIRTRAYKLLGLATDLDVSQSALSKLGTAPGAAWDTWVSLKKVSPLVTVGAVATGWVAPRFRSTDGTEWRWTGARGLDPLGRHVQVLRGSNGVELRLAREDVEAFVREGELVPVGSVAQAEAGGAVKRSEERRVGKECTG
jgi:hypothetical protein